MTPDEIILRPPRKTMALIALGGLIVAAVGLAVSGAVALFLVVLGLIALVGGSLRLVPGLAYLKLDDQGFKIKQIGKSWGALWLEVESFEPTNVLIGRSPREVVEVHYREGFAEKHLPTSTLGKTVGFSQRYMQPGYGLKADAQAALLNEWLGRFGS